MSTCLGHFFLISQHKQKICTKIAHFVSNHSDWPPVYMLAVVSVALKGETWEAFSFSSSWTDLGLGGAATGTLLGWGAGNRFFPFCKKCEKKMVWREGKQTNREYQSSFLMIKVRVIDKSVAWGRRGVTQLSLHARAVLLFEWLRKQSEHINFCSISISSDWKLLVGTVRENGQHWPSRSYTSRQISIHPTSALFTRFGTLGLKPHTQDGKGPQLITDHFITAVVHFLQSKSPTLTKKVPVCNTTSYP